MDLVIAIPSIIQLGLVTVFTAGLFSNHRWGPVSVDTPLLVGMLLQTVYATYRFFILEEGMMDYARDCYTGLAAELLQLSPLWGVALGLIFFCLSTVVQTIAPRLVEGVLLFTCLGYPYMLLVYILVQHWLSTCDARVPGSFFVWDVVIQCVFSTTVVLLCFCVPCVRPVKPPSPKKRFYQSI
jgi:hypothetical protein